MALTNRIKSTFSILFVVTLLASIKFATQKSKRTRFLTLEKVGNRKGKYETNQETIHDGDSITCFI